MSAGYLTSQFADDSITIDWLTNGTVSHVDLVLPTGLPLGGALVSKGGELLGARFFGGVQVREPGYKKFKRTFLLKAPVPNIELAYAYALSQVGKSYNSQALIDMALHRERKFNIGQKSWFCDELNYTIYMVGGLMLLNTSNPLGLTPEEEMLSPLWEAA